MTGAVINRFNTNQLSDNSFLLFRIGVIGYVACILFNGVLMHYGLSVNALASIRVFLPELFFIVMLLSSFRSNSLLDKDILLYLMYLIALCFLSMANFTLNSFALVVRDVLVPVCILLVIGQTNFSQAQYKRLFKSIVWLFRLFAFLGLIFAIVQYINGWQWTSRYFLGYEAWGNNDVRIVYGWLGFKVLGPTGDPTTFAFYNIFVIILLLYGQGKINFIDIMLSLCALVSIVLTGNRTALLFIIVLVVYKILTGGEFKKFRRLVNFLLALICCSIAVIILFSEDSEWTYTVFERFELWSELFDAQYIFNLFIPHSVFEFAGGEGVVGLLGSWDNTFLYMLFSFGIVGFVLFIAILWKRLKKAHNATLTVMTIFVCIAGLTTNIFFGRNILGTYLVFVGLYYSIVKRDTRYEIK